MNVTPSNNDFWRGIGGHFDTFTQIICEFIDNSISNFEKYQSPSKSILVTIDIVNKTLNNNDTSKRVNKLQKASKFLKITIEDTGTGMTDIQNMLTVGNQQNKHSILNEHGFGLKHALAAANPDNDSWKIYTRTKNELKRGTFSKIQAPYKFENLEVSENFENWEGEFNSTGTIIEFNCTQLMFSTVNKGKKGAPGLALQLDYLCEDLGFIYAGMIKDGKFTLTVKSNNIIEDSNKTFSKNIKIISPIWAGTYKPGEGSVSEDLGGGTVKINFKFGEINESEHHKYYKRNMATSGVEIRINGRLLVYNLFYEIWQLEEHPSYNKFLAVIDIISDNSMALPITKTAKNGIKTGDEKFDALIEWIKKVHPRPVKKSSDAINELDLVAELADLKRKHIPSKAKSIEPQHRVYIKGTNCPVPMDLYVYDGYEVIIYEAKKDNADLQSLYQLLMYWDGMVNDGKTPNVGILLASTFSVGVSRVISQLNEREDLQGNKYNFEIRTWKDEGINYPD